MKRLLLLICIFIFAASAGIAEEMDIPTLMADFGYEPLISDNSSNESWCNYRVLRSNSFCIEWSDDAHSYTIKGDGQILPQLYINLLTLKDWDSCRYEMAKRTMFSYNSSAKSKHRCETLDEYIEMAEKELNISGKIEIYPTMQIGDRGDSIAFLQNRLKELHYLAGKADGDYGEKTKRAVASFQSKAKLEETGIADMRTQLFLFSDDAPVANQMSVSSGTITIGNLTQTMWEVDGQEFTLQGNETKTLETRWGVFLYDALGNATQIE